MSDASKNPTETTAHNPTCCNGPNRDGDALLERLANRPLPVLTAMHRQRVLGQARIALARRRIGQEGVANRHTPWWRLLLRPQVLAGGSAALIGAAILWSWQAGLLHHASTAETDPAAWSWTGATRSSAAWDEPVDMDSHLRRVRERVEGIVGRRSANIDRALSRAHHCVTELNWNAGD